MPGIGILDNCDNPNGGHTRYRLNRAYAPTPVKKRNSPMELGKRERQIMAFIYKNGPSTAADVMDGIANAPSYSGVRAMLRILEEKGFLKHAKDGSKYVYSATQSADEAGRAAMSYLLHAFFGGSTEQAVAALLDVNSSDISDGDFERLEALIQEAKETGR